MSGAARTPRRILVTGGCGFIGSAFVRALVERHDRTLECIVNLDALTYAGNPKNVQAVASDPRYVFVHAHVEDGERVARACDEHVIDTVVHFAAESHVDRSIHRPLDFVHTNVVGTTSLLEVVRTRPHLRFHHVSTDEVFGSLGADGCFREDSPYRPSSPYAASKAAADHMVRAYAHTYGIATTISNCTNNYGPFQFAEKLVPLMISNLIRRLPLPIYGDGSNVRDWIHVDDHVDAIWEVLVRGNLGETYNIAGNAERTNLQMVEALIEAVAERTRADVDELRTLVTFVGDRPGHDQRYALDGTKTREQLGIVPARELARGLRLTVDWYLDHPDWLAAVR